MHDDSLMNAKFSTTVVLVSSSGYFSTDITDLRELRRSHSPLDFKMLADQNKSGCEGRDMRTLVDISPLLKPSERYLAAQVACDAV